MQVWSYILYHFSAAAKAALTGIISLALLPALSKLFE